MASYMDLVSDVGTIVSAVVLCELFDGRSEFDTIASVSVYGRLSEHIIRYSQRFYGYLFILDIIFICSPDRVLITFKSNVELSNIKPPMLRSLDYHCHPICKVTMMSSSVFL